MYLHVHVFISVYDKNLLTSPLTDVTMMLIHQT